MKFMNLKIQKSWNLKRNTWNHDFENKDVKKKKAMCWGKIVRETCLKYCFYVDFMEIYRGLSILYKFDFAIGVSGIWIVNLKIKLHRVYGKVNLKAKWPHEYEKTFSWNHEVETNFSMKPGIGNRECHDIVNMKSEKFL